MLGNKVTPGAHVAHSLFFYILMGLRISCCGAGVSSKSVDRWWEGVNCMVHSCMLNQLCHRQLGNEWWYCYPVVFSTTDDKHPKERVSYRVTELFTATSGRRATESSRRRSTKTIDCSALHIVLQCLHCIIIILYSIWFNVSWVASVTVSVYT